MRLWILAVVLILVLTGCSTGRAVSASPPATDTVGRQNGPSPTPTPQQKNIVDTSAAFTVTTGDGYTADAKMSYSIAPFTKSIVDATPGHTNLSAVITATATATNTTTGRRNPETFKADGWIAYDTNSVACTSQIGQVFTHLHTKNGRYCLFNTASFSLGPFEPSANITVDSSQFPNFSLTYPGVSDADVTNVIAAASQPSATMIEAGVESTATITTHAGASLCQIVGDRDVLHANGGYAPFLISAVMVSGVGCDALTAP
ncbi:hypothetical protein [Frigoribacterium sp. UYMn621]|uniref:hypothetical protein n=1 Tax=Frigoribacterium sp. UYMn621 TaxID=3156343 RepID=UPI0033983F7A